MAKNEWPLLGLSICHALNIGVSHIVIVDHASTDETVIALKTLKTIWPDRLTLWRSNSESYQQEITCTLAMKEIGTEGYDWVYVFDADEFALLEKDAELPDLLRAMPDDIDAVRYELHQFASPYDMNDRDLSQYGKIDQKCSPCNFLRLPDDLLVDEFTSGNINYFDIPFPSKVIVRSKHAADLFSGSHMVKNSCGVGIKECQIETAQLRVAHLPLLSKRRLAMKAQQGKLLALGGFPRGHGWQSQAIWNIQSAGLLDVFWKAHSICDSRLSEPWARLPAQDKDDALAYALRSASAQVQRYHSFESDLPRPIEKCSTISLDVAIELIAGVRSENSNLRETISRGEITISEVGARLGAISTELDGTKADLVATRAQLDGTIADLVATRAELDDTNFNLVATRAELERANTTLMDTRAELERTNTTLGTAKVKIRRLKSTYSWRLTSPFRTLSKFVNKLL